MMKKNEGFGVPPAPPSHEELREEVDRAIHRLHNAIRKLESSISIEEMPEEDLDLWMLIVQHSATQKLLDEEEKPRPKKSVSAVRK